MDTVEVYRDSKGEWRWRRQSENGEIVSTSGEGYQNLSHAVEMAEKLNGNLPTEVLSKEPYEALEPGEDT